MPANLLVRALRVRVGVRSQRGLWRCVSHQRREPPFGPDTAPGIAKVRKDLGNAPGERGGRLAYEEAWTLQRPMKERNIKMEVRVLLSAVAVLALVACDDSHHTPPAKCRALARHVCEALIDCGLADVSDMAECMGDVEADAQCDDAIRVEPSYDDCLDDVASAAQCAAWPDLPASCEEVISVLE